MLLMRMLMANKIKNSNDNKTRCSKRNGDVLPDKKGNNSQCECNQKSTDDAQGVKVVMRKCVVCGKSMDEAGLIRFCASPDETIYPDLADKLPGRGVYVSSDAEMVRKAIKSKVLSKNLQLKSAKYPDDMIELIDTLFVQRLQNLLGLAKKSGVVIAGFDKVEAVLEKQRLKNKESNNSLVLLEATDGSNDGKDKLLHICPNIPVYEAMKAEEMGVALGQAVCVHALLLESSMTDLIVREIKRLTNFRQSK